MMKIFESLIYELDLVFDVGSNMGDKCELFLGLNANVVAFEPQEECYLHATKRFEGNTRFKCENVALSNRVGVETMYVANYHTISSMSRKFIKKSGKQRFSGYSWNSKRDIKTDTLDRKIVEYGVPAFIKIDVEGYELMVLKGLSRPIRCISVEFNPELCSNTIKCINYIDNLNKHHSLFNYGYRNNESFHFENWLTKTEIINYLKSVDDHKYEFGDVYCKHVASV